ncbi:hypothetical protein IIC68_02145 [archaeon]|nr:hypothetical protein [archaeon]
MVEQWWIQKRTPEELVEIIELRLKILRENVRGISTQDILVSALKDQAQHVRDIVMIQEELWSRNKDYKIEWKKQPKVVKELYDEMLNTEEKIHETKEWKRKKILIKEIRSVEGRIKELEREIDSGMMQGYHTQKQKINASKIYHESKELINKIQELKETGGEFKTYLDGEAKKIFELTAIEMKIEPEELLTDRKTWLLEGILDSKPGFQE